MKQQVEQTLRNAFVQLHNAEAELCRPKKDSVTLCACLSTKNSARDFFRSYLLSKSFDGIEKYSLADLQYQCAKIDSHFNAIDLSCFECRNEESDSCDKNYCLSVEKVNKCFERANTIRELVMEKLKLTEKSFV